MSLKIEHESSAWKTSGSSLSFDILFHRYRYRHPWADQCSDTMHVPASWIVRSLAAPSAVQPHLKTPQKAGQQEKRGG
jgi:hypothetical protein